MPFSTLHVWVCDVHNKGLRVLQHTTANPARLPFLTLCPSDVCTMRRAAGTCACHRRPPHKNVQKDAELCNKCQAALYSGAYQTLLHAFDWQRPGIQLPRWNRRLNSKLMMHPGCNDTFPAPPRVCNCNLRQPLSAVTGAAASTWPAVLPGCPQGQRPLTQQLMQPPASPQPHAAAGVTMIECYTLFQSMGPWAQMSQVGVTWGMGGCVPPG